ncbi:UNVERIFIED_ORG: hypothetical protein L601_003200000250 [Gordonia westfalica J30]
MIASEKHHALEFVRRWSPYDKPPAEDIWITFGLTEITFYRDVLTLLRQNPGYFDAETTHRVEAFLLRRLYGRGCRKSNTLPGARQEAVSVRAASEDRSN